MSDVREPPASGLEEKKTCSNTKWRGFGMSQTRCKNSAKVVRDGKPFCGVHDPQRIQEQRDVRTAIFWEQAERRSAVRRIEAAGPQMLALLKESQTSIGGDWRERRDAIIAKAEGQAPEGSGPHD